MPNILKIARFGNPILRQTTESLTVKEVQSSKIQMLIKNIRYTLVAKEYGVGLAAPQVGEGIESAQSRTI